MEIEKKFLVRKLPENLTQYSVKHMEQGYLCTDPVLRIRKSNDRYILTYKSRIGLEGPEGSVSIRRLRHHFIRMVMSIFAVRWMAV